MFRKIKLYGKLAEFVGADEFEANVASVGSAIRFLLCNFPEVEQYMNPNYYQVKVGNYDINESEINYPVGQEDIHFIPVIAGSGGLGKALLGAAMIGLAFATGGITSFSLAKGLTGTFLAKTAVYLGASLVISGVAEMLFPLPDISDFKSEDDPSISFNFSGIQNTSRAGIPVPVIYGEVFTGSVVISAALDTAQVDVDDD